MINLPYIRTILCQYWLATYSHTRLQLASSSFSLSHTSHSMHSKFHCAFMSGKKWMYCMDCSIVSPFHSLSTRFFFCFLCSDKFKIFIHAKYNAISIDLIPLHMRMAMFIKCMLLWSAFLRTFSSYFYRKFLSLTLDSLSISRTYWINVLDNKIILDASEKSVSGQPTTVRCALWTWIDSFLSFSGDESKSETAN